MLHSFFGSRHWARHHSISPCRLHLPAIVSRRRVTLARGQPNEAEPGRPAVAQRVRDLTVTKSTMPCGSLGAWQNPNGSEAQALYPEAEEAAALWKETSLSSTTSSIVQAC
jgi:hypothetical protein